MSTFNLVTAVTRPDNLDRIYSSIALALWDNPSKCNWILVADERVEYVPARLAQLSAGSPIKIRFETLPRQSQFGIYQKNLGLDLCEDGFFYCLDDDNILHPAFFERLEKAIAEHPEKRVFAFHQHRWDRWGLLRASPETMEINKIDNAMFIAHKSLIGPLRYDYEKAGCEDYFFYRALFDAHPEEFWFLDDLLAFYNFLRRE
jgi:Glycosyl transferase family 2